VDLKIGYFKTGIKEVRGPSKKSFMVGGKSVGKSSGVLRGFHKPRVRGFGGKFPPKGEDRG